MILFDIYKKRWHSRLSELQADSNDKLPRLAPSDIVVESVTESAAR